jgi:ribosomal protein L16 Arg81 hydroxylase
MNNNEITLNPGDELYIPSGSAHSGRCTAGTRTIHAFGAKMAEREGW